MYMNRYNGPGGNPMHNPLFRVNGTVTDSIWRDWMENGDVQNKAFGEDTFFTNVYTRMFSEEGQIECPAQEVKDCFTSLHTYKQHHGTSTLSGNCLRFAQQHIGLTKKSLLPDRSNPQKLPMMGDAQYRKAEWTLSQFNVVLITEQMSEPILIPYLLAQLGSLDLNPVSFFGCTSTTVSRTGHIKQTTQEDEHSGNNRSKHPQTSDFCSVEEVTSNVNDGELKLREEEIKKTKIVTTRRPSFNIFPKNLNHKNPHNASRGLPTSPDLLEELRNSVYYDSKLYCSFKRRLNSELMRFQQEHPDWWKRWISSEEQARGDGASSRKFIGKSAVDTTTYLNDSPICV